MLSICVLSLRLVALPVLVFGVLAADRAPGVDAERSRAGSFSAVVPGVVRDGLPGDAEPDAPLPYPAGTRTGIDAVDLVLAARDEPQPDTLQSLFVETPSPCIVNPQGVSNPPLCPPGVAAGTLVPVFRASACESVWPDYLPTPLEYLWRFPRPVLAIYRNPSDAYSWLPAADFAVVLQNGPAGVGRPAVVRISGGRINGIAFSCGQPLSLLIDGVSEERFVLPRLVRLPVAAAAPAAPKDVRAGLITCVRAPCPGYYVEWTDTSVEENGFLIYWRETSCADAPRQPVVIAVSPANSSRRDELSIPFREGCSGQLGVASYNGAGFSQVVWTAGR